VLARSLVVTVEEERRVVVDRCFWKNEVDIGRESLIECGDY